MSVVTANDGHIKLVVDELGNNATNVTLKLSLITVLYVINPQGTIRLAAGTHAFAKEGSYSPGTVLDTLTRTVPYDGQSTVTSTTSFTGQYSYRDEEDTVITVNYYDNPLTAYYTATRPVYTTISTSANSVTLGNSIDITTSGGSSGSMTFKIGNTVVETKTGIGNTTTQWTPALNTYAPYITGGTTATVVITWNNVSKSVTVTVPNNSSTKPTVSVAVSPVNPTGAPSNIYVKGISQASFTVTASGKLGATITARSISINGETFTSASGTTGILNTVGSNTCSVTVTDSRGIQNTASVTITVLDYNYPTISNVNIYRADSSGNASNTGTYLKYVFTPTITSLSNTNAKTYVLQRRLSTSSTWTEVTGTLGSYTAQASLNINANLSTTSYYIARVRVSDSFGSAYSAEFSIPTEAVMMDFNSAGTGGGIGMYTQAAGQLDIAWNIKGHGTLDTTNYPVASTQITPTYITNPYCSSTSVGRVWIRRQGSFGFLHFNLSIDTTSLTSSAGFVQIMSFSGVTLKQDEYCTVASQSGQSTLLMQILWNGTVQIYTGYGSASGFYRAEMPLIFA